MILQSTTNYLMGLFTLMVCTKYKWSLNKDKVAKTIGTP